MKEPLQEVVAGKVFDWADVQVRRAAYPRDARIFEQGDPCASLFYIESGTVRLSVISPAGKEAVVAVLEPGQFFGESCLSGQTARIGTATAMSDCRIVSVEAAEMRRQIHDQPALAEQFLAHMLKRNARVEQDLIDHLFNSSEKRLARTLLLLAHYGDKRPAPHTVPRVSQELLAEMVGTTRSRVNGFMNRFRSLGFIEYNGTLKVNASLLSFLLNDGPDEMAPPLGKRPRPAPKRRAR